MRQSGRYNADEELLQRPRTAESYRNPNNDITPGGHFYYRRNPGVYTDDRGRNRGAYNNSRVNSGVYTDGNSYNTGNNNYGSAYNNSRVNSGVYTDGNSYNTGHSYNTYASNRVAYNNSWMNSRGRYRNGQAWRSREYENTYDMGSNRNYTNKSYRNKSTVPSEDPKGEHWSATKQKSPSQKQQTSRSQRSKYTGPSGDYNEKERETEQNLPSQQKHGQNLTSSEDKSADSVEDLDVKKNYQMMLYRQAVLVHEGDDDGWPHIMGNCPDMCPAEEREKRARLRDLAVFERVNNDQSKTSKELAVKKFCRTFSGKNLKQSDIRPLPVLYHTMQHLLKILDMESHSFQVVHDFLFDRTRAVRQELSMQRIVDSLAVSIYETIVRFHIMSERELRQQRAYGKVFDSHLNFQQLSKALLSLLNLYLMHNDGFQNEAEFYCYYVLLNLNQPQQLSLWFQSVKPGLLKSNEVQFARNVLKYYQQKNYRGFFRLVTKATYLQACLMELYFNEVRAAGINMINSGAYKLHPYPLSELADLLLMEVEDMEEFCILHGLAVGLSSSNELQLLVKQASFTPPTQDSLRHYYCQIIQNKRPAKFKELCTNL